MLLIALLISLCNLLGTDRGDKGDSYIFRSGSSEELAQTGDVLRP